MGVGTGSVNPAGHMEQYDLCTFTDKNALPPSMPRPVIAHQVLRPGYTPRYYGHWAFKASDCVDARRVNKFSRGNTQLGMVWGKKGI